MALLQDIAICNTFAVDAKPKAPLSAAEASLLSKTAPSN